MDKPWCNCAMNKQDGYRYSTELDCWVHADCGKMSKKVFQQKLISMSHEELQRMLSEGEN